MTQPRLPRGLVGRALLATAASQLVGLIAYDVGTDPAGLPLEVSPLNALMLQVPLYAAGLLIPVSAWALMLWLTTNRPALHRLARFAGVAVLAALALLAQVDLGMQRFRGERVSWNTFATYGSDQLFNSDWIRPVIDTPVQSAMTFAALGIGWIGLVWAWRAAPAVAAGPRRHHFGIVALVCAAAAVACYGPTRFAYYHQRQMARPPQAVLAESWLAAPTTWSASAERAARDDLRIHAAPVGDPRWLADSFPIYRAGVRSTSPAFGAAAALRPDIILVAIESLRGRDVGWGFGDRHGAASLTPHLDSLARESVTWPRYIASGEPSPRGFIALHTGHWEHGQLFIIANRPDLTADAIPLRLRAAGYRNIALWGGNPSFDNQLTWARRWYDETIFQSEGNSLFYFRTMRDRDLMDRVIASIEAHDRDHAGRPLFAFVSTAGTHTPYDLEDGAAVPADVPPSTDRQRRYDLALRNVDAQLGRVVAHLRARNRWRNTVIIITGDHADRTTEAGDPRWRGMPTDAMVGTAALIFGPRALIGTPRADSSTASHVDLLPTIASWFADTSAIATMGRDLFAPLPPNGSPEAVAINSRGYRMDRGGFTLMVDSRDPANFGAWKSFTGESPTLVPLAQTPFAPDEAARLHARIQYWSHLVDQNRVRPAAAAPR